MPSPKQPLLLIFGQKQGFSIFEGWGLNAPSQVGLKMQKLSNLASQQWSTPPRIILIKFHQNQPKVAPVLEKSTLLADFALAPFKLL